MKYQLKIPIFLKFFNKCGGEGQFTKIVKDMDISPFGYNLEEGEEALIFYNPDDSDKAILITNQRIIEKNHITLFTDLYCVSGRMREEYKNGVRNKGEFTLLELEDYQHNKHVIKLEAGSPFWGIWNALLIAVNLNYLNRRNE